MMRRFLILAAVLLPFSASANGRQFQNGEPVAIQSDQAYILVRTFEQPGRALAGTEKFAPVLIRTLDQGELNHAEALAQASPQHWQDQMESNVVEPLADRPYEVRDGEEFLIISLKPGEYVLGGIAVTSWAVKSEGMIITSLCMGTVKFEAKPGVITDLGAILMARDDETTNIPELSTFVSAKPRGFGPMPWTVAVRPETPTMETPDALKALSPVMAEYRAVGAFPNYLGARISRLAPIPKVLDYDKDGNVVDLKANLNY